MKKIRTLFLLPLLFAVPASAQTEATVVKSEKTQISVEVIASGLQNPWGLAFLPDGRALVTERPGRLRIIGKDNKLSDPVTGVPEVAAVGQGGLLDVALSPNFVKDNLVFLSFAEPRGANGSSTSVARGKFVEKDGKASLEDVKVIFRQEPARPGGFHFGSRLVFARDGNLFITTGERNLKTPAQELSNHIGKIIRVTPDGGVPKDNPFVKNKDAKPEIWSYGHRNVQGAVLHPQTGKLWIVEHGPRGGDEINIPEAGKNYGWPVIGYGIDYSGAKIHESTHKEGMEQPIHYWTPSIAPSGAMFYTGDLFPEWKGNLFTGSLVFTSLYRVELNGEKFVKEEALLEAAGDRIRDVRQAPDGAIWLLTDARNGKVLRLTPAK
ncbi:MAG: PQQ-dependent sugar dehydrogenase [Xanthobacteraceae bacterium]|nr:PQQ-dependent sugar dehydrogenase [Xanthobacteraceae bacterium]MCW5676679.1 PQQ-dependent sugar dehydrogenase [Xanthobacteraceae bacterium]